MKYTSEIVVNIHREVLIEKLDNADNMKFWQRGFISYEVIKGIPGEEDTQMELNYKMGKREVTLTETIVKSNFPEEFHVYYDTKGVQRYLFISVIKILAFCYFC